MTPMQQEKRRTIISLIFGLLIVGMPLCLLLPNGPSWPGRVVGIGICWSLGAAWLFLNKRYPALLNPLVSREVESHPWVGRIGSLVCLLFGDLFLWLMGAQMGTPIALRCIVMVAMYLLGAAYALMDLWPAGLKQYGNAVTNFLVGFAITCVLWMVDPPPIAVIFSLLIAAWAVFAHIFPWVPQFRLYPRQAHRRKGGSR